MIAGIGNDTAQLIVTMIVAGMASKLVGGKFANGANTAAFQYLMNWASSEAAKKTVLAVRVSNKVFFFEGVTAESVCGGMTSCLRDFASNPVGLKGMIKLSSNSKYYVSTISETYKAYISAAGSHYSGLIGDTANTITVFCPACASVTAPISAIASATKFYFEPSLKNLITPLAGQLGNKLLYNSGRLTTGQSATGAAAIELGSSYVDKVEELKSKR